jgi:hypothetical protein
VLHFLVQRVGEVQVVKASVREEAEAAMALGVLEGVGLGIIKRRGQMDVEFVVSDVLKGHLDIVVLNLCEAFLG